MTFDDFEVYVRREIDNYLNIPISMSTTELHHFDSTQYLVLEWRNTENNADIRFAINFDYKKMHMDFDFILEYDAREDGNDHHSCGTVQDMPSSEEDYFQKSTVHDLGFRWEFYQYLYDFFEGQRK